MKYKLLYVDDEESNLRMFKSAFRRKYKIYTALSAKKGLEILETERVDMVLSDQRMPEMTGVEFLKYISYKHPQPIRILITAYADYNALQDAVNKAHIYHYIQKPWDEVEMERMIESALGLEELKKENSEQRQELIYTALKITTTGRIIRNAVIQLDKIIVKHSEIEECNSLFEIQQKLKLELKDQDNWELFNLRFKKVHASFFERLTEEHPDISKTELRYCAYLRIHMTTKQIAIALNVTLEAIRKTRYRLRKKIGMDSKDSLEKYIAKF